jgi:hypothetical protein
VEDGEADALIGELGHRSVGLAAPEAVEAVGAEDVGLAIGVEVEGMPAVEFDRHGVLLSGIRTIGRVIDQSALSRSK